MVPRLLEPKVVKHLYAVSAKQHIPVSGTFELTPMCNMSCEMCYVRMTKADMDKSGGRLRTKEEWLKLAEDAKAKGMLFLLLTGGEPFLYPEFKELYQQLSKMGFVISINSNATMIDEKVIEYLKENAPIRINITLYGASNETYDRLCHNPKGYTQVTRAIQLLKNAGIAVKLNCSVTPYNVQDLPAMIRYAQENKLILQATSYMFPPLRRDESMVGSNARFTAKEASRIAAEIVRLQNGDERFEEYVKLLEAGQAAMETDTEECLNVVGDKILCSAGRCAFWITWDGRMLPCGMLPQPISWPFKDGFEKAWQDIGNAVDRIHLPVECSDCKDKERCHSCAAMVFTETGTFDKVPEYRCQMTKCYQEECRKIQKQLERRNAL